MTGTRPRPTARELIETVAAPKSWRCWDKPVEVTTADPDYLAALQRARERTGLDESVITGECLLSGQRVAIVACEFGFLAGSIGVAAGERLVRAVERATAERLPLLAAPASGGTRMQEGTVAFVQMVKVTAAITAHKAAGLPYLVHLRHPTTGGVLASWGSLGHVTSAEPGALIGFLGPRVHEALYGERFPAGVQVAENLLAHGLVDAVLPTAHLPGVAARALRVLSGGGPTTDGSPDAAPGPGTPLAPGAPLAPGIPLAPGVVPAPPAPGALPVPDAAESIRRSRRPERPGVRALLRVAAEDVTPLSGTGAGEHDPGMLLALAKVGGTPCVVLGHDRGDRGDPGDPGAPGGAMGRRLDAPSGADAETGPVVGAAAGAEAGAGAAAGVGQPLGPAGLRTARRGMRIAAELGLPLLTVVDTAGAALSQAAEEGGLAGEIARCLADLVTLPAPTLCLLLGQGAGGGALALLPADRVLAARHAWLSPLPPEGASAILYRTTERAYEVAARQGVRSADLLAAGIVDRVVEETEPRAGATVRDGVPGAEPVSPVRDRDAADAPAEFLTRLGVILGAELAALRARDPAERLAARRAAGRG
ncbi:carboxyl transferase domain-containing protein [Streptomyces zagrosensis]|uniref:Acetyl-coenzyme A carboxylase carboxyl transferase subunits beta/alpha n=1 Tax=Streptomyces zagrosensis TaxID=1042984 RepID=A0A7W9QAA4_9ACTN|nr:carboxyl transferase domain-containing protein [Streptomyces zagrosensis]MBB5936294.1 acetyl-CoA carboxylase carboxyl transferase subunit beta [Streptomyces zagrosensis]